MLSNARRHIGPRSWAGVRRKGLIGIMAVVALPATDSSRLAIASPTAAPICCRLVVVGQLRAAGHSQRRNYERAHHPIRTPTYAHG